MRCEQNSRLTSAARAGAAQLRRIQGADLAQSQVTAPYMHKGSLATLRDVVRHTSELDEDRLHTDGKRILRPLRLSEEESIDLVVLLESLSAYAKPPGPIRPPTVAACR
jgi:cytochrome c peroxidase